MTQVEWRVREGIPIPRSAWLDTPRSEEWLKQAIAEAMAARPDESEEARKWARDRAEEELRPETLPQLRRTGSVLEFTQVSDASHYYRGLQDGARVATEDGDIAMVPTYALRVLSAAPVNPGASSHPWIGKRVEWRMRLGCHMGQQPGPWSFDPTARPPVPVADWHEVAGDPPSDDEFYEAARTYVESVYGEALARQGKQLRQSAKRTLVGNMADRTKEQWQRPFYGTVFHQQADGDLLVTDEKGAVHSIAASQLRRVEENGNGKDGRET